MAKKIIIAEDNQDNRECRVDFLEMFNMREGIEASVEGVPDGKLLVEKVREGKYDLIFIDYEMPKVNGLTAIRQIREFNKNVPVYMVSGSDIKNEALECGATGYIDKCHNSHRLIKKAVRTHLK